MEPTEFLDAVSRVTSTLTRSKSKLVSVRRERNQIRSLVAAWFGQYRPAFHSLLADEMQLRPIDDGMHKILKLASGPSSRLAYKRICGSLQQYFRDSLLVPLSRAHWSRAPEKAPAGRDPTVATRLGKLDPDLAESYEQVVADLSDNARRTYRATGSELREVLRGALERLAPDKQVMNTDWYREARRTGARKESGPTHSERTKFILRQRDRGSADVEAAESYMLSVEDRLGHVVRASYRRASDSTHSGAEREEVAQQLRYVNALLTELLPPESSA